MVESADNGDDDVGDNVDGDNGDDDVGDNVDDDSDDDEHNDDDEAEGWRKEGSPGGFRDGPSFKLSLILCHSSIALCTMSALDWTVRNLAQCVLRRFHTAIQISPNLSLSCITSHILDITELVLRHSTIAKPPIAAISQHGTESDENVFPATQSPLPVLDGGNT